MANLTPEEILRGIIDGSITEIGSNDATTIGAYKLYSSIYLQTVAFENVNILYAWAFFGCSNLESVYLPSVESVSGLNQFNTCTKLRNIYLPKLRAVGNTNPCTFENCSLLETVVLPSFTTIIPGAFARSNTAMWGIDIYGGPSIQAGVYFVNNSPNFNVFIIRRTEGVPTLNGVNGFSGTPFASGGTGGTLYVPQSLISSYQSATNWSTILSYTNNQILPIEGSEYEHYYVDGTPIPT